ncbi:hypothetical protein B5S28_g223 [[Candida] boidinii]|nr:hypothetical protein B5S28_g223 [[Candida] boidinii]OWB59952.1 hypothetical protein B5S29_g817 [[Candida] boidinii]OWB70524.1 hypothetical protein B5S31_g202 [[Candida] boidinii]
MSAEQVKNRLRPFGISFEKSLSDLIKGIRYNNKDPEKLAKFLEDSIQECRDELRMPDMELKSIAILKLTYLEMYGFDMSWCAFKVLEVMSSQKFQHKRIGYLAAIQILQRNNNDDALMLITNLLKKDLSSSNFVESGMAISGIASIVSPELAQDICDDIAKMLNHSKPFIRKKAVLAMYKIFLKYPESLKLYLDRLVDKLEDEDVSVVSATVNVICELAKKNPSHYVDLAPRLYGILQSSTNNWMVIRLLKLFSSLSVSEPRLRYKLLPELVEKINTTPASSLIYECINCILNGNMLLESDVNIGALMVSKLLNFFQSEDNNLRYVGLLAFIKTVKIQKDLIVQHEDIILNAIDDYDLTIREKALEIIDPLVSESNIVSIVKKLLLQLIPLSEDDEFDEGEMDQATYFQRQQMRQQEVFVPESYKYQVITKVLEICSMNNYRNIPNFHWYINVLKDIIKLNKENKVGNVDRLISEQFLDMSIRVPSIRFLLVSTCIELVTASNENEQEYYSIRHGLRNYIWIIGEYYNDYIYQKDDDYEDDNEDSEFIEASEIIKLVSEQSIIKKLSTNINDNTTPVYIQSMAKLFNQFCQSFGEEVSILQLESIIESCKTLISWLEGFENSVNFEVQERACSFLEILKLALDSLESESAELSSNSLETSTRIPNFINTAYNLLFTGFKIKPVSHNMQLKIPLPEDVDLKTEINKDALEAFTDLFNQNQLQYEMEANEEEEEEEFSDSDDEVIGAYHQSDSLIELSESNQDEDRSVLLKRKQERLEKQKQDPFYISLESDISTGTGSGDGGLSTLSESTLPVHRKPKKPKAKIIKREKVLVLDDEDIEDSTTEKRETDTKLAKKNNKSGLVIDSSKLDSFDLSSAKPEASSSSRFNAEYEVEKIRQEASTLNLGGESKKEKKIKKPKSKSEHEVELKTSSPAVVATDLSDVSTPVVKVKKPKKPKKKVAVIN